MKSAEIARPQADWSVEQLTEYFGTAWATARATEKEAALLGRRAAAEYYHCGHALSLIRAKRKESNSWGDWLKSQGLKYLAAHRAILLYERAGSVEALGKLSITQAYVAFGITPQTQVKSHCRNLPFEGAAVTEQQPAVAQVARPQSLSAALASLVAKLQNLPAIGSDDVTQVAELIDKATGLLASIRPTMRAAA